MQMKRISRNDCEGVKGCVVDWNVPSPALFLLNCIINWFSSIRMWLKYLGLIAGKQILSSKPLGDRFVRRPCSLQIALSCFCCVIATRLLQPCFLCFLLIILSYTFRVCTLKNTFRVCVSKIYDHNFRDQKFADHIYVDLYDPENCRITNLNNEKTKYIPRVKDCI